MRGLLPILVVLLGLSGSLVAAQTDGVDVTIFVDAESLTVYVPGNQPVALDGFGFEVEIDGQPQTFPLFEYPSLRGIPLDLVEAPICFRLVLDTSTRVAPAPCADATLSRQRLTASDIFWYDTSINAPRPFTIVSGMVPVEFCTDGEPECTLTYRIPGSDIDTTPDLMTEPALNVDNPTTAAEFIARGDLYLADADLDAALADYQQAATLAPTAAQPLIAQARVYDVRGQYTEVLPALELALELDPDSTEAYALRADLYRQQRDLDAAEADYQQASLLGLTGAPLVTGTANITRDRGDLDEALRSYDAVIASTGDYVPAYVNRAIARAFAGDTIGALEDLGEAETLVEEQGLAPYDLVAARGDVYHALLDTERALEAYREYETLTGALKPYMQDRINAIEQSP